MNATLPLMSMQVSTGRGPVAAAKTADETQRAPRRPLRIAIVEDEAMVAWALESMAEDLGHEIAGVFASGEEALATLASRPPDMVFMDINLGDGIDGIETASRLRAVHPVAMLFISAYSDPETRERALAAAPGALLLGKPVQSALLENAIARLTGRRN